MRRAIVETYLEDEATFIIDPQVPGVELEGAVEVGGPIEVMLGRKDWLGLDDLAWDERGLVVTLPEVPGPSKIPWNAILGIERPWPVLFTPPARERRVPRSAARYIVEDLLDSEQIVVVALKLQHPGVFIGGLADEAIARLRIGHELAPGLRLAESTEAGLADTLTYLGTPHRVRVPWDALVGAWAENSRDHVVFVGDDDDGSPAAEVARSHGFSLGLTLGGLLWDGVCDFADDRTPLFAPCVALHRPQPGVALTMSVFPQGEEALRAWLRASPRGEVGVLVVVADNEIVLALPSTSGGDELVRLYSEVLVSVRARGGGGHLAMSSFASDGLPTELRIPFLAGIDAARSRHPRAAWLTDALGRLGEHAAASRDPLVDDQ